MRPWIPRSIVVAVLVTGTFPAIATSTGPPASRTGAPAFAGVAAEPNCRDCHVTFPLNAAGATLEILDVPEFYLPDTTYTLRVRMSSTFAGGRRWGFQVTAVRASNGQGIGTFNITGLTGIQVVSGFGAFATRRYVEHTSAGTFPGNLGPVEWILRWRASNANVGRIYFFAAGNAANNSNSNTGDHIYTQQDSTDIHPLLDAPPPLAGPDVLEQAAPNPFRSTTAFSYTLSRSGAVELTIFDAQGRVVRRLFSGERPAGRGSATWDGRRDDGAPAAAGVYHARLSGAAFRAPVTQRVVLAR